jgi:hypothetical protein
MDRCWFNFNCLRRRLHDHFVKSLQAVIFLGWMIRMKNPSLCFSCPSILNIQPWLVRIADHRNGSLASIDRTAPIIDPQNREILLSMGAFVENLSIAAAVQGLRAEISVLAQSPLIKILYRWILHKPPVDYPIQRLELRHSVKRFLNKPLTLEQNLRSHVGQGHFLFPSGTEHATCIRTE